MDNCNTSDLGIIDPVSSPKIFSLFLKCTFSDTLTFLCTSLHPGIAQNKVTAAWDLKAVALLTCDMPEITCNWTPFATHTSNYQGTQYMKHLQKQSDTNLTSSWLSMNPVIKSTPHIFDRHNSYIVPSTDLLNGLLSPSFKKKYIYESQIHKSRVYRNIWKDT